MRGLIRILVGAVLGALAVAASCIFVAFIINLPSAGIPAKGAIVTVEQGEKPDTVSRRLERQGLIRSAMFMQLLTRIGNRGARYHFGSYRVTPGMTTLQIQDLFITGKQMLVRLTVPEGWTVAKLAAHLEEKGLCPAAGFEAACTSADLLKEFDIPARSLEGYLRPDTYFIPKEFDATEIARMMVQNFFKALRQIAPEAASLTPAELFDKVRLASIVEREYRDPAEAPLMASVFYNRLRIGMALQSCATVEYIITDIERKPHQDVIHTRDLGIRNLYNTYMFPGLPPGPISNPGSVALDAVFHPATTDYWYFRLIDPQNGRHHFSRTLSEHKDAGLLYVKREKSAS